jgi:hypothetical protein
MSYKRDVWSRGDSLDIWASHIEKDLQVDLITNIRSEAAVDLLMAAQMRE